MSKEPIEMKLPDNKERNKKKTAQKKTAKRLIPKANDIAHHVYFPDIKEPAKHTFSEFIIEEVKEFPKQMALLKEHPDVLDDIWIKTVKGWMPLNQIPLSKADAINRVKQAITQARPHYTRMVEEAKKRLQDTMQQAAHQVKIDDLRLETLNNL